MKIKLILMAVLVGAATFSAHAGICFGFSFGIPLPGRIVVAAPVAPVMTTAPVAAAPLAVAVTSAGPAPGYCWVPGYWSVSGYSRVWVPGCWQYHPVRVAYAHPCGWRSW